MNLLKFNLGQEVIITASEETGKVIARAEYCNCAPTYRIRYKQADGKAVEMWWDEDALEAA